LTLQRLKTLHSVHFAHRVHYVHSRPNNGIWCLTATSTNPPPVSSAELLNSRTPELLEFL
jgi:hypothetical protein